MNQALRDLISRVKTVENTLSDFLKPEVLSDDEQGVSAPTEQGQVLRSDAALQWVSHTAKTAGQILVGDGTDITSLALSQDGTLNGSGQLTVTGMRTYNLPAPTSGDNNKAIVWDHTASEWKYVSISTGGSVPVATAQGSILRSGVSPFNWEELLAGSAYKIFAMDSGGTTPSWQLFDWDTHIISAGGDGTHNHSSTNEGGLLNHADLTGVSEDQHHNAFVGLEDTIATQVSPAANNFIQLNSTSAALTILSAPASNRIDFTVNMSSFNHNLLSSTHSDTVTSSVSRGSLVIGNSSPAWSELTHPGFTGYALVSSSADVLWSASPSWAGTHTFNMGWIALQSSYMSTQPLLFDNDGDTGLRALADDELEVIVGGNTEFTFKANELEVETGSFLSAFGIRDPISSVLTAQALYVPWKSGDTKTTVIVGSNDPANNQTGLFAESYSGVAIGAQSNSGTGIQGNSSTGTAIYGETSSLAGATQNGVWGFGNGIARGVYGQSNSGVGVEGSSATGYGLIANLTGSGTAIAEFRDAGSAVVHIADGGKTGFGTTNPIYGWIQINSTSNVTGLALYAGSGATYRQYLLSDGAGNYNAVFGRSTSALTGMIIDTNGRVGVYTGNVSTLSARLTIGSSGDGDELLKLDTDRPWVFKQNGSGATTDLELKCTSSGKSFYIRNSDDTNIARFYNSTTGQFSNFYSGGGNNLTMTVRNRKVAIGNIAAPTDLLHVYAGASGATPHSFTQTLIEHSDNCMLTIMTPANKYGYVYFANPGSSTAGGMNYNHSSGNLGLRSNDAIRLVIDSSGFVGIGVNPPSNAQLHLNRNATIGAIGAWNVNNATFRVQESSSSTLNIYMDGNTIVCGTNLIIGTNSSTDITLAPNQLETIVVRREGKVLINTTTVNTFNDQGLTISQRGYDDEILSLSSTDVGHGMTSLTMTTVYGTFKKAVATTGGVDFSTYSNSVIALEVFGYFATNSTAKNATANAAIEFYVRKKSGTTFGNVAAGQNALAIKSRTGGADRNIAIFSQSGDIYLDSAALINQWDDYEDIKLLQGLRASLVPTGHELRKRFGHFIEYARPVLERTGVVEYNDDGHHFVAVKQLQMLTIDTLRQAYERIEEQSKVIFKLGQRIAALEQKMMEV